MLVLSAPSGAGKTTLAKLLQQRDEMIKLSVSATTRRIRAGEVEGRDYFFVDKKTFKSMIAQGAFLEYAEVFGNLYGTPRQQIEGKLSAGVDVLFDIDWQGQRLLTEASRCDVVSVFVLPPSKEELCKRLAGRHGGEQELVRARQELADSEISHWHEYDYVLVNENLEDTLQKLLTIIKAERLKRSRVVGLIDFVKNL
jgi:guanylate kinase